MKKLVFLFLLIISLSFISAVEFDIKNSYSQGETLIAKLSGNFVEPVLKENIFFYEDYVRVPIQFDITKIEDEYYIYALLPEKQKNYTISIEDVKYYKGSKIIDDDIRRNFSITSEFADFSIEPGFVVTSTAFSLKIQNLQESKRTIKLNYDGKQTEFTLKSGEKKIINFKVENVMQDSLKKIELSSDTTNYEIPIYVFTNSPQQETGKKGLKFEITNPEISMSTNSTKGKIIYLRNTGDEDLENILLVLSDELMPYISLSKNNLTELKKNSSEKIELLIKSGDEEKNIIGEINAKIDGEIYTSADISLNFLKDFVLSIDDENTSIILTQTCDELGGKICAEDESCVGEKADSFEGDCCLSKNCSKSTTSSWGAIIGWAIVVVVVIFLVWFFLKKYRGAKAPLTILEKARGRY